MLWGLFKKNCRLPQRERRQMLLCRDDGGRVFILHKANMSSGGTLTQIETWRFRCIGKAGPEHQALGGLIGSVIDQE
jgi:hypothetical protein